MYKYLPGVCATLIAATSAQAEDSIDIGGVVIEVENESPLSSQAEVATGSLDIVERMDDFERGSFYYDLQNNTNGALIGFGVSNNDSVPLIYENLDIELTDDDDPFFRPPVLSSNFGCTLVNDDYDTCYTTRVLDQNNWGEELVVDPRAYQPPMSELPVELLTLTLAEPTPEASLEAAPTEPDPIDLAAEFEPQTFLEVYGSFESVAGDDNTINWFDFYPQWTGSILEDETMNPEFEFGQDELCVLPANAADLPPGNEFLDRPVLVPCEDQFIVVDPIAELMNSPLLAGDELNGFFGFRADLPRSNVIGAIGTSTGISYVTASPAPVPLPAAGWMLIAGVGGLVAAGRRKRG